MPTEATFLLAGLLFIAAASGWAFERFTRDRDRADTGGISADYFRGLNLVLNRKTDEALELFVKIARVDDDTLETHFALGHLFRKRGEVDRAIRVHQNLLARPSLSEAQRHQALFALAEDYLGAGLFDRAEQLFEELTTSETLGQQALERLIDIYERESEWRNAIDAQRQLERYTGDSIGHIPHYYCELAARARADGDTSAARELLTHAVKQGPGALRSAFLGAVIAGEEGRHEEAVGLYKQVLAADRRFIPEVLPALVSCYLELGQMDELETYIRQSTQEIPALHTDFAYAAIVGDLTESPALTGCIEYFVESNEVLLDLVNPGEAGTNAREGRERMIKRVTRALRQLAINSARYRCTNCGYSAQRLIWQCPSCKQWDTVRPIQSFQFETLAA